MPAGACRNQKLKHTLGAAGSPLVQTLAEIGLNKSSFTGKTIYNFWDDKATVAKKITLYLQRQIAPSLAPGGYGFTRLQKAITKQPDYFGRTSSLPTAAASTLLGLNTTPVDVRMQRRFRKSERDREIREISFEIGRVRRNRGLSRMEKQERIRALRGKQREIRSQGR